jgi:predicted DNA-binding transcriptional regulator AlpA
MAHTAKQRRRWVLTRPDFAILPDDALIHLPDVLAVSGYSRSTTYEMIRSGRFPPPFHPLGSRAARWRVGQVKQWLRDPKTWRSDHA